MFNRLENHFIPAVKKLENAMLKMFLVNAVINNKPEKVQEFFSKMTPELQGISEWKDWFGNIYFMSCLFFDIQFSICMLSSSVHQESGRKSNIFGLLQSSMARYHDCIFT